MKRFLLFTLLGWGALLSCAFPVRAHGYAVRGFAFGHYRPAAFATYSYYPAATLVVPAVATYAAPVALAAPVSYAAPPAYAPVEPCPSAAPAYAPAAAPAYLPAATISYLAAYPASYQLSFLQARYGRVFGQRLFFNHFGAGRSVVRVRAPGVRVNVGRPAVIGRTVIRSRTVIR